MTIFGPYSPIVKAGDLFFVSGQIGVHPDTKDTGPDIQTQTSQAMSNMKDVLHQHNLGMENVVKTTIYVTDMGDFEQVNDIYQGFFADPKPARATVSVKELPRVADTPILVEIEAVASVEKRTQEQSDE